MRDGRRRPVRRRLRAGRMIGVTLVLVAILAAAWGGLELERAVRQALPGPARPIAPRDGRPTRSPPAAFRASAGPNLPQALAGASAAYQQGAIWLAGGLAGGLTATDAVWRLAGGRVAAAGRLPAPSHDATLTPVQGGLLYAGGGGSVAEAYLWRLAAHGPSLSARSLGALPRPLSDLAAVPWRGGAVLAGGYTGSAFSPTLWHVTAGGRVSRLGSLPTGLRYAAAARMGDRLWLFGGLTDAGVTGRVWSVSLSSGAVTACGRLAVPVQKALAWTWGGAVYVAGGLNAAGRAQAAVTRWEVSRCRGVAAGRLPVPLAYAAVARAPRAVWLLGGIGAAGAATDRTWRLSPAP
jgi:hypothetical protein